LQRDGLFGYINFYNHSGLAVPLTPTHSLGFAFAIQLTESVDAGVQKPFKKCSRVNTFSAIFRQNPASVLRKNVLQSKKMKFFEVP
jgi:hypothetical protein